MATYQELFGLRTNSELQNKIAVAVTVAAQAKLAGTPTSAQAAWAIGVLNNPSGAAAAVINAVLAANKASSAATILAATDATIQSSVDAVIDGIITAGE